MVKHNKLLLLIDGNALIHRAYHALPTSMTTKSGEITNAVYGFTSALMRAIEDHNPSHIACCFDVSGGTFRNRLYDKYKANRKEMDSELADQLPRIYEAVNTMGIKAITKKDYEADDLIGTLAKNFEKTMPVMILTGDKDTLQLVDEHITVETFKQGVRESVHYTVSVIKEQYGISPEQFIFFKALRGDPSDNIPGVSGVGEVTGLGLVKQFGNLENMYKELDSNHADIKESIASKLINEKKMAILSYKLAEIDVNVPIEVSLNELLWEGNHFDNTKILFEGLEFHSLLKRLQGLHQDNDKNTFGEGDSEVSVNIINIGADKLVKDKKSAFALEIDDGTVKTVYVSQSKGTALRVDLKENQTLIELLNNMQAPTYIYDLKKVEKVIGEINNPFICDLMLITQLLQDNALSDITNIKELNYAKLSQKLLIESDRILQDLAKSDMTQLWQEIEQPLTSVLKRMEDRGVKLNTTILNKLSTQFGAEIAKLEQKIYAEAGEEFNILSPAQLREVLFQKLKISAEGIKKNKTGTSTDAQTLEQLKEAHPIVPLVLRYREISKLKNTYVDALPNLVDAKSRLHTTYNQLGATTGRISSEEPNLQNIPISSDEGNEIRSAFVAESGYKLISADYSQIELRILAHLSGDATMIESFKHNVDIHLVTASKMYDVAPEKVTPEQRRNAKTVNFSLLYGLSAHSLSLQLKIDHKTAQDFIDRYFTSYPKINNYLSDINEEVVKKGYYTTMFGRRRKFPEIHSHIWSVKAATERMAKNFPMQGAQADILKMAMLQVEEYCHKYGDNARMILTVHDEIVLEVKTELVDQICQSLPGLMTEVCQLKVPLAVGIKVGDNWRDMKEIK